MQGEGAASLSCQPGTNLHPGEDQGSLGARETGFHKPGLRQANDICLTGLRAVVLGIPTTIKP